MCNIPVLVFGSNLAGRHGKGAALFAKKYRGAIYGVGEGRQGNSYAIPTKDKNLKTIPLYEIEVSIHKFMDHANIYCNDIFEFTPIGCGLAGHKKKDIWKILLSCGIPSNVLLSRTWVVE